MALYQSEITCCISSSNNQHCHVGGYPPSPLPPKLYNISDFFIKIYDLLFREMYFLSQNSCLLKARYYKIWSAKKIQYKNRPWDLLIHLLIVRQTLHVFVRQYRLQRHILFHQSNHNNILNKKYNIFSKTNVIYYWETSSVCLFLTFTKWHHSVQHMYKDCVA